MDFQERQAQHVANFQSSPKIYVLEELIYSGFDFNELEDMFIIKEYDIKIDHPSLSQDLLLIYLYQRVFLFLSTRKKTLNTILN